MARKWSNLNLPGALHYVTGNFLDRTPVFTDPSCCKAFLDQLKTLLCDWPSKLIAYVLMPDHFHLIVNPRDGRIREFMLDLKGLSAKRIVQINTKFDFPHTEKDGFQVWQESFKDQGLWSGWMIWQKINYIHANPVKARLVKSAVDYYWSSFRSFYSLGDEPLAVDHDWWWPDDSEKLSAAMKELGWYSYHKRK
ncbi:MAG TPA: transposase [Pyrinomonadaceae bacterium]|nr:transposase [Pyrinomonadaceae bacterium]